MVFARFQDFLIRYFTRFQDFSTMDFTRFQDFCHSDPTHYQDFQQDDPIFLIHSMRVSPLLFHLFHRFFQEPSWKIKGQGAICSRLPSPSHPYIPVRVPAFFCRFSLPSAGPRFLLHGFRFLPHDSRFPLRVPASFCTASRLTPRSPSQSSSSRVSRPSRLRRSHPW